MFREINRPKSMLRKKADRGFRGYPLATIALYGPAAERAAKIAVFKVTKEGAERELMDRWIVDELDVRRDPASAVKVMALLRAHQILSVLMADRIIGCPHEEGVDYTEGQSCPQCPFLGR